MRRISGRLRTPVIDRRLVPILSGPTSQNHLLWLSRKFTLGQDALLISESPSEYAQLLALRFAEMAGLELEYVTLGDFTRENDLKQSRDFHKGGSVWTDEAVVRALLNGRFLVLDGLHRVEANVLPLLNSLLEAREMQLDDGRLITSHEQYSDLLKRGNTKRDLERNGVVACHPDFRVLGLCLPCPPFAGNPLDPPLRSRLQSRFVRMPPLEEIARGLSGNFAEDIVKKAVSATASLMVTAAAPPEAKSKQTPKLDSSVFFSLPFSLASFWGRFPLSNATGSQLCARYIGGGVDLARLFGEKEEVVVHDNFSERLLEDLELHTTCTIVGAKGSGRRYHALQAAARLGQSVEMMTCFPNMSPSDLFASRSGSVNETVWKDSSLVRAMKEGSVCIVEGIESW
jgi:hypothetical protein